MDVAAWLRGLGLEQYAPAFRDNDVDGEVLPELTADDLTASGRDLGRPSPQAARRDRRARGRSPQPRAQSAASATSAPISASDNRCRTPAADGDVLRSGRLDGALDAVMIRRICGS